MKDLLTKLMDQYLSQLIENGSDEKVFPKRIRAEDDNWKCIVRGDVLSTEKKMQI